MVRRAAVKGLEAPPWGPFNSIVADGSDCLYLSDEINHRVISLDPNGRVRWRRGKGKQAGEFLYPRGLSFGLIDHQGESIQCLAVADGWNHRVQFMNLDGDPIHSWAEAGAAKFAEITDVRYIQSDSAGGGAESDFWLVLDKGNHRLYGIAQNGRLIFQIGQAFLPSLESQWAVPAMFFSNDFQLSRFPESSPYLDFLYCPQRIFGNSMRALFLLEPLHKQIKQVFPNHLLPIAMTIPPGFECFNADSFGMLCWNENSHQMLHYDWEGCSSSPVEIAGSPVFSYMDGIWIQNGDSLQLFKWNKPSNETCAALSYVQKHGWDSMRIRAALESCFEAANHEADLVDSVVDVALKGLDVERLKKEEGQFVYLHLNRMKARQGLFQALHDWCLGSLGNLLIGASLDRREISDILQRQRVLLDRLKGRIGGAIHLAGDFIARLHGSDARDALLIPTERRIQAISAARNDLVDILLWVGLCLGTSFEIPGIIQINMPALPQKHAHG